MQSPPLPSLLHSVRKIVSSLSRRMCIHIHCDTCPPPGRSWIAFVPLPYTLTVLIGRGLTYIGRESVQFVYNTFSDDGKHIPDDFFNSSEAKWLSHELIKPLIDSPENSTRRKRFVSPFMASVARTTKANSRRRAAVDADKALMEGAASLVKAIVQIYHEHNFMPPGVTGDIAHANSKESSSYVTENLIRTPGLKSWPGRTPTMADLVQDMRSDWRYAMA